MQITENGTSLLTVGTRSGACGLDALFTPERSERTLAFHRSLPGYEETPLVFLKSAAERLGVASLAVKDESPRFGLNAFKALGGSYCTAVVCAEKAGAGSEEPTYGLLTSPAVREKIKDMTLCTATDGNHGRGVAYSAKLFGLGSVVYMPKGSEPERLENIRRLGAEAEITPWSYDETVIYAARQAEKHGWTVIQDTTSDINGRIPLLIMQGYLTMMREITDRLPEPPTHVFLQAGVGSMAGAAAAYLKNHYGSLAPVIAIVEPTDAACIYESASAGDGLPHAAKGSLSTMMAGLACGVPCAPAWELIRAHAAGCITIPDSRAADAMRLLARPVGGDRAIVSGESGASGVGAVLAVTSSERMKEALGIDSRSRILCISTEGDTCPRNYRRICGDT